MFIKTYGFKQYVCDSSDIKQTDDIELGSKLLVVDTQEKYLFNGTAWVLDTTK